MKDKKENKASRTVSKKRKSSLRREIHDYDNVETGLFIDRGKTLRFEDLNLSLPPIPPTQVVSIRLPSSLINELRAIASQQDIAYQALIKMFLAESVEERQLKKKRTAA